MTSMHMIQHSETTYMAVLLNLVLKVHVGSYDMEAKHLKEDWLIVLQ